MKYLARRIVSGEWLDRDLPLSGVERARVLSGPTVLTGAIEPDLRTKAHSDGLRVLEDWATMIYATSDDESRIFAHGIVMPPTSYEEDATRLTCAGFSTYPHGFPYDDSKNWGPIKGSGTELFPETPRPDAYDILRDLWAHVQSFPNSNLGVTIKTPSTKSYYRLGDYEEPYRLRWWENPDVGAEIDRLAQETPFDYVETVEWADAAHTQVKHEFTVAQPRHGRRRDDMRFVLGENVTNSESVGSPDDYANDVRFIGNGEGSTMKSARATTLDGRLRRTKIVTDKTLTLQSTLDKRAGQFLNRFSGGDVTLTSGGAAVNAGRLEIGSISIIDHPHARIDEIDVGDDIYVQTHVPAYGDIELWCRVLEIRQGEDHDAAVLTLRRSSSFLYATPTTEIGG